jgi:ESF2/ABP1 family protein
MKADAEEYLKQQKQKGVIYLSTVPRYMNVASIREYFSKFSVERVYLTPDSRSNPKKDGKQKVSKRRLYKDGWIEFKDKRVARMVSENFNGNQVGGKKGSYNYYDTWNIRYLPKFKWDNLTERIEYDRRVRAAEFNQKLSQSKKEHDFIIGNIEKGKTTKEILKRQVRPLSAPF